ncbi:MAG: DUF1592 domain-containing protein [Myxococcales bacterium]|nr:DUF1592 domain-containing protein [Myxococcales bacterium]
MNTGGLWTRALARGAMVGLLLCGCSGSIDDQPRRAPGDGPGADPGASPGSGNPGTGAPGTVEATPGDPRIAQRIWRLTPEQLNSEVRLLFGDGAPQLDIPESAAEAGFTNIAANGLVDLGNAARFSDGVRAIGSWVADQGATTTRCAQYGSDACVDSFMAWFLRGAFRRPVSPEETAELRGLFDQLRADYDFDYAIAGLVRAVLLSPDFLYRSELGEGGVMTAHEIANLLAFAITDRSPDAELFDAAERGELADADNREAHARRLMDQSDRVWQRLFWEWLSLETLYSQGVEVGLDPILVEQMEEEYRAFVTDVVVTQRGTLRELLSASYSFARPQLAAHYGADHPSGSGLERVELDPRQRGGLLTQGAWLVSHGKDGKDNVVRRGMNIFKQAMCNNNLAPPEGLDVEAELLALVGEDATVRETVDARAAAPTCGACHRLADPMGMVFETYTSDGRWQGVYPDGTVVDSNVAVDGVGDFDNAPAMSAALADAESFQHCFVRRVTHYLMGIDMGSPGSAAWVQQAHDDFVAGDTSLEELLVSLVRHPAFIERPTEVSP